MVQAPAAPHFDSRSRIFELDSCGGNGKVCLVYKNCTTGVLFVFTNSHFISLNKNVNTRNYLTYWFKKNCRFHFSCWFLYFLGVVAQQSEIWFLDRSLCWHFLTATFTSYYRLMITHLGLPEWQYAFTPYGPSPQAKVPKSLNKIMHHDTFIKTCLGRMY